MNQEVKKFYQGEAVYPNKLEGVTSSPQLMSQLSRMNDILSSIHNSVFGINEIHSNISPGARYDDLPADPKEEKPALTLVEKLNGLEDQLSLISNRLNSMRINLSNFI